MLYGFAQQQFGLHAADDSPISDLPEWLHDRELMTDLIKQHLHRAKQRMKKQAGENRSEREFQVEDWVFLKLQPYVQSSLAAHSNQKLAFKYFGPFRIIERIGSVAYKLELPASSSIHPVFHVSQLKKAMGAHHIVEKLLPPSSVRWSIPEKILQHRTIIKGSPVRQGLVKWSQLPSSLSTWKDLEYLRQQFPRAAVWGHPGAQEGGDVSIPSHGPAQDKLLGSSASAEEGGHMKRPRVKSTRVFGSEWAV